MKAPLSHNFKSLHATQLSTINNNSATQQNNGLLSNTQPNSNMRKLHQRSLANNSSKQQRSYNNEDLLSPPSVETFGAGSISQTHRQQSMSSEMNSSEGSRQQRPLTANRAFVMSQAYGQSGKELSQNRRQAAQSTLMPQQPLIEEFYRVNANDTRNIGEWSHNRQQHSSMQEQQRQQPYQWPSVNTNSKRILDFSTGSINGNASNTHGPYQSIPQVKSSSQGQKTTNFQNYQRRDSVQYTQETFQSKNVPPQHQMLSSRKLPDGSGQTSPIQDSQFYYSSTITDPRTRAATNTQQTRTLSQGREGRKIQVRQEHASPLRATGSYNDTQSTQLRASQKLFKEQAISSQLNSAFATLSGSGRAYNQFQHQQQPEISSSNTSTLQPMSTQKQPMSNTLSHNQQFKSSHSNFQSIKEPEQLRTPPVAPMIYDDALEEEEAMRGLRINDLQKRNLPNDPHSSQEEFELMVQKMQSRMKALESRYLDLANFYKRELLANGTSIQSQGDLTPYLAESQERKFDDQNDSQQHPFDQNIEKDLINDLLQEKSQLEKDLQDMMVYQFPQISPTDLNESQINVEGRIRNQQTGEEMRGKIGELLARFQEDFLEFINRNYQSFTENDVLDMFNELRTNLEDVLQQLSYLPHQHSQGPKLDLQRALSSYHLDMQETLKQAITEYELNYGYNIQTIKKTAFQLQSKHSTAQLDSKKAQIALQAIYKKCGQLQETINYLGGSNERSPPPVNQGRGSSLNRGGSINQPQMSPSSANNGQQRLINEIQGQVQVLSQSLFQISDKLVSGEDDLRYLMTEIEDEHQQAINRFKINLEQLSNETYQKSLNQLDIPLNEVQSPMRDNFINQNIEMMNQQLQDLNAQLEADLQMAQTEIYNLKEQLSQSQHQQNLALNRVMSFGQSSSPQLPYTQSYNDGALLTDHRLSALEFDNKSLTTQIRHLQKQLDDKSSQADRLASELAAASSQAHHHIERSRERSKERVQLEQIQFYQKKYDDSLTQTKDVVRLTQRFLVSLKKLQKAVHRKESNVSNEKVEFEDSRRELEARLKQVKRELDQLAIGAQSMKISNQEMMSDDRDPYSINGGVEARINRYQNKAPHTLSERDFYQKTVGTNNSQSRIAQNPYRDSRSQLLASNIVYEQEEPQRQKSAGSGQKNTKKFSLSREKSPVPLRQQNPLYSRNQTNPQQRDMFRSIEAVDRFRHQPLLQSSNSNKKQQTSSSAQKATSIGGRSNEQLSQNKNNPQRAVSTSELHYQQTLNQLRSDFNQLRNERDQLLGQVERLENELLERRQEVERLNEEKMMMPRHGPEQIMTDRDNQQDTSQLQHEIDRLNQEIDQRDSQLAEYEQRTKQIEESFQKQIQQLKERSLNKDLEIGQLRKTLKEQDSQSSSFKNIKTELMDRIQSISQESEYKLQELEMLIQSKEQQIVKLERNLEKKMKLENNSAQKNSLNEQQYVQQIQNLKGRYQEKESKVQELQEELKRAEEGIREMQEGHAEELQTMRVTYEEDLRRGLEEAKQAYFKIEIDLVKSQNEQALNQLRKDHSKQLEKVKSEYQGRLEKDRASSQEQLQNALNQAKLDNDASLKQKDQAAKQQIQSLSNDYKVKLDALTSQLNDSNSNNVKLEQQYQNTIQQLQSQVQQLQNQVKTYLSNIESLNFQVQLKSQDRAEAQDQEKKATEAKIAQLTAKLEETEQALEEAEGLINEVQSENQLYKKQVTDTIKQANEVQTEAQAIIDQLNQQIGEACEERDQAYERIQELEGLINQANREVQASQTAMQEIEANSKKAIQDQVQAHQLEKADLAHQLAQKDSILESLQAQHNQLLKERDGTLSQTEQEILSLQNDLQLQKQSFTDQLHQASQLNSKLNTQIQTLTSQNEDNTKSMGLEITSLKALCDTLNQRLTKKDQDLEAVKDQKQAEIKQLQTQIDTLKIHLQAQDQDSNGQLHQITLKLTQANQQLEEATTNAQEAQQQLQEAQESHYLELQALITKHSTEVGELKKALDQDLQDKLQTLGQQHQLQLQTMQSQSDQLLTQLKNQLSQENTALIAQLDSKDAQINLLTSEKDSLFTDLSSKLKESEAENQRLNDQINTAMEEIEAAAEQIQAHQDQLRAAQEQYEQNQQMIGELQQQVQGQQNEISECGHRISSLNRDLNGKNEDIARRDAQISQLQAEKQQAVEQVKELIDQSSIEKQSLEDILKTQLTQAMLNIEDKDRQIISSQSQIEDLQRNLRESQQAVEELAERASQAEQAFEQLDADLQAKEEKLMEHQQTLAKNRDLIVMLKDEYKKVSDKGKVMVLANAQMKEREQELTNQVVDLTEQIDTLTQRNDGLTEQVQRLKSEYAQKHEEAQAAQTNLLDALNNKTTEQPINNNSSYVHQMEEEMKAKDELIDEANQCIEEFNNEKHELKAKFKHFIQVIEDPNLLPEEESSYKEEDDIDLNYAFDLFERQIMRSRQQMSVKLQSIQEENSRLKDDLDQKEEELRAAMDKMGQVNGEITRMKGIVEENDKEMRRQMENASKKIDKYKEQVRDKQAQIEQLKISLDLMASVQPSQQPVVQPKQDDQETLMLLQKLQKAEQELQQLRQQAQFNNNRISDPRNQSNLTNDDLQTSFKLDAQRLQSMENQLVNLRRQLFEAKDQVIDQLTAEFAKKLKEQGRVYAQEQIMKSKLSEIRQNLEGTLNNNVKCVKVVRFSTSLKDETVQKRLLVVQVINNNECYVIDEAKLSEAAVQYVRSYLPEAFEEDERLSLTGESKLTKEMKKLEEQVREIREERLELYQELMLYKEKIKAASGLNSSGISDGQQPLGGLTDLKGAELEEEVTHLGAENLELRQKMKQLSEQNKLLQLRILELNDLQEGSSPSKQLDRQKAEIESLKKQLQDERMKSGRRTSKPQVQIDHQLIDEDQDDNSFLEGIQVAENIGGLSANRAEAEDYNLFDQSSINLGEEYGIANDHQNQQNDQHRPGTNPAGNYSEAPIQVMEKLQKENEDLKFKLQQSQQQMQSSSVMNSGEGMGLSKHIKHTLLQFLKNCPVTDRNNEQLLTIVLGMMEFTKDEISEVQDLRQNSHRQMGTPGGVRANSVSSGGALGGTDPGEDEVRKKTSKGIFGMFRKGSRDKKKDEEEKTSNTSMQAITPTKALAPIGRR